MLSAAFTNFLVPPEEIRDLNHTTVWGIMNDRCGCAQAITMETFLFIFLQNFTLFNPLRDGMVCSGLFISVQKRMFPREHTAQRLR
jgi:hypothetical protein